MSEDRRRQQQRQRQRRRRQERPAIIGPASPEIELPGVFGWMQRNGRFMILIGIVVMVLSLGGAVLAGELGSPEMTGSSATATPTVEGGQPVGTPGPDGVVRRYSGAPPMEIDPAKRYEAVFHTEKGDFRVELLPNAAPRYVNNFVFLARNDFYDGLTFHRVLPGFVAQGGDPLGSGTGGPGYVLPEERNSVPFEKGVISMASSSAGVSGSQFFITLAPQPELEPRFTAFGRVVDGMAVVEALTQRDPQLAGQPPGDRILGVEIVETNG